MKKNQGDKAVTEKDIFHVEGSDRRKEILKTNSFFKTQSTGGADVDYFSPETGFVLLKKERVYSPENTTVKRVKALCDLSLNNPPLGLRQSYYTVRQTPSLIKAFKGTSNIYGAVLQSINDLEILADVDRDVFVEGKNPKGVIFYPYHFVYGNIKKPIGFTENIAKNVLNSSEIENCKNIIAIEKLSAAIPLADSKFPKLTNSLLVTTGGFYTRGISTIIKRFVNDKNVWLWTDADVWGVYMREVIKLGSMNARHLDDKIRNPNVVNAGLKPSVARDLSLPNDIEEKRPMGKPEAVKRIELLKQIGFPEEDYKTFEANSTFELEALDIAFRDKNNNPVGQSLYLAKMMELTGRQIKPFPDWTVEWLQEKVCKDISETVKYKILNVVTFDTELKETITDAVYEKINDFLGKIPEEDIRNVQNELNISKSHLKSIICEWYVGHMEKEVVPYDLVTKKSFDIKISSTDEKIISEKVNKFKKQLKDMVSGLIDELDIQIELVPKKLDNPKTTEEDMYKQVYKELKIKSSDEERMENALSKYINKT